MSTRLRKGVESIGKATLAVSSLVALLTVLLLTLFIVRQGLPTFSTVSPWEFLFSKNWSPSAQIPHYGIFSFLVDSLIVTTLSLLFATPVALATSLYLALFAKGWKKRLAESSIDLLSGIPSVIFGLFGIAVVVPLVRNCFGGNGYSLLSASIVLSIMILPTIIGVSKDAISAVASDIQEASCALGATRTQTIFRVVLPAARSGLLAAFALGLGRAVGETTAVLLVGGNAPLFPESVLSMGRTLTMNIVTDMSYAEGTHMSALFATAMLLYLVILILNSVAKAIGGRSEHGR